MDEDDNHDIKELFSKSRQVVLSSHTPQRVTSVPPPPILHSTGEINAPPPLLNQNLEMGSWLHHPNRQDYFFSVDVASTPATHPQSSLSLAPPPPPYSPSERMAENYMNFSTLIRENVFTGGSVEARPLIPVVRESTLVGSSTFSATGSYLTPATFIGGVSSTFSVPPCGRKDKAVATAFEIAGTSSSYAEAEPVQIQPATETEIAGEGKRKEREETFTAIQVTEEASGSTSRKRSRAAEMHNLSERRRRKKINEKMKTLQELIPRCNKNDKASMLDDVIHYVKSLQMQVHMMSMGYGTYGMMYEANTQRFVSNMAMGMNRPPPFVISPREVHTAGLTPSYQALQHCPFINIQASGSSRVPLPSLQPGSNPASNQPQFPAYSQFVSLHQMHQPPPPPLQSQTTSQQSYSQASCSKEHEDQDNQPTD